MYSLCYLLCPCTMKRVHQLWPVFAAKVDYDRESCCQDWSVTRTSYDGSYVQHCLTRTSCVGSCVPNCLAISTSCGGFVLNTGNKDKLFGSCVQRRLATRTSYRDSCAKHCLTTRTSHLALVFNNVWQQGLVMLAFTLNVVSCCPEPNSPW